MRGVILKQRYRLATIGLMSLCLSLMACNTDTQTAQLPGSGGTGYNPVRKGALTVIAPLQAQTLDSLQAAQQNWLITPHSKRLTEQPAQTGQILWLRTHKASNTIDFYAAGAAAQGVVEAVDEDLNIFTMYDTQVIFNQQTQWLDGLQANNVLAQAVAVDGYLQPSGHLIAQRIRRNTDSTVRVISVSMDTYDAETRTLSTGFTDFILNDQTYMPDGEINPQVAPQCVRLQLGARQRNSSTWPVLQMQFWHTVNQGEFLGQNILIPTKTEGEYMFGCQRVYTTAATQWKNIQSEQLPSSALIEVYGTADSSGRIQATYIQALTTDKP
ncbi:DUF5666 domain-containing protein [Agitococcus lubricus]|uniref:DUF5666 domain-containing protein n=1 Tax=Agitococcus lubricus TaxID=1077255 RepID=A0A2T5IY43_9GAMM|nr:DUF5666 domain-containing protein [Agitococcus lubricus]PTQ88888.1 hypothetical protein C8N29_11037 [Agitococcus lubricus]